MNSSDSPNGFRGRLIAVEGLDGSGKSTQLHLVKRWLESLGVRVYFTEWNSSVVVKSATSKGKQRRLLTPTTFSLIHATDFFDRYERQIQPLLRAGYVVLCDRYVFTAYVRDVVRGCDRDWVRNTYSIAVKPDITFYFRVPLEVALRRVLNGRQKIKYHEAGMDLKLSKDTTDSFKLFQGLLFKEYDRLIDEFGFSVINAALPVEEQQADVRRIIAEQIDLDSRHWKSQGGRG